VERGPLPVRGIFPAGGSGALPWTRVEAAQLGVGFHGSGIMCIRHIVID